MTKQKFITAKQLTDYISEFPPSYYKGRGDIPYIRVADIVNWEIYKNPNSMIPYDVYQLTKGVHGVNLQE